MAWRGWTMASRRERGTFLTVMAVLFGVLTISNVTKPLQHVHDPGHGGIVVFGVRASGLATNLVLGPLMGVVLAAYAFGVWNLRRWVLPLSIAYAFYVPVNLVLFGYFHRTGEPPSLAFSVVYLAFALGGSLGTALYLAYHRERLA